MRIFYFGVLLLSALFPMSGFAGGNSLQQNFPFHNLFKDRSTSRWDSGKLRVKQLRYHEWDGAVGFFMKNLKADTDCEFSCDVEFPFYKSVYLQAKFYRNGKETSRIDSSSNQQGKDRLSLRFNTGKAEKVLLQIRFECRSEQIGKEIVLSGFYLGTPLPVKKINQARLVTVPGFEAVGFYLNNCRAKDPAEFRCTLSFRPTGEKQWQNALVPVYDYRAKSARGSLLKLKENTSYDYRLEVEDDGKYEILTGSVKTRNSEFPVAETILLNRENFSSLLKNIKSGSPNGYIRYTGAPGFVIQGGNKNDCAVDLSGAKYVILENMTIRGGRIDGIRIRNAHDIIIRNCEIAGFARRGVQRTDIDGKYFENEWSLNNDCGIRIIASERILVERCFIHSPRGTANSWFYSHPAGPNGIFIGDSSGVVLRSNDIVGNSGNRWNDAVESRGNGREDGGPKNDAEIYGNYFAFGNDDGMELDGGQRNCRFAYNKTEGMLCGVSAAPCLSGPSYLWQNLFCRGGDEYGYMASGIKNYFRCCGFGALFFFNNTILDFQEGIGGFRVSADENKLMKYPVFKVMSRNNLVRSRGSMLSPGLFKPQLAGDADYDQYVPVPESKSRIEALKKLGQEHHAVTAPAGFVCEKDGDYRLRENAAGYRSGTTVPNLFPGGSVSRGALQETGVTELPYRAAPFHISAAAIKISADGGTMKPVEITIMPERGFTGKFRIVQPDRANFFRVVPSAGIMKDGKPLIMKVFAVSENIRQARRYLSAFTVRLENGLSRPVSVEVDSRQHPVLFAAARAKAVYGTSTRNEDGSFFITADIPETADYWLFVRENTVKNIVYIQLSIDGEEAQKRMIRRPEGMFRPWSLLSAPTYSGVPNRPVKLKAGKHTFKIMSADGLEISDFAVTQDADVFRLAPEELRKK